MTDVIKIVVKESEMSDGMLCGGSGRRCAIGHLLHALNVDDEDMREQASIEGIFDLLPPSVADKLEAMGLIDTDDPGRDADDPRYTWRCIDTPITNDIYTLSDESNWADLHEKMLKIGVDFTVTDITPDDEAVD
jgi:hypothetical protein